MILYAALGSSRHLVTGPMAATAALSAAAVGDVVCSRSDDFAQLTVALALCVGLAALIAGILRLGFLASFISEPVLKGFIVGLALTIIIGQVPKLHRDGVRLLLAGDIGQVRDVLRQAGGPAEFYPTVEAAVEAAQTEQRRPS